MQKTDFPIFGQLPHLVYLDSAATSQKPNVVLEAEREYYEQMNANIHRSAHFLAEKATVAYEATRKAVATFIHAKYSHEIVFTRNATESINLVARSYGDTFLGAGDEILLSKLEHHSNLVPWLQLKERKGVVVRFLEIDAEGQLVFDGSQITEKTKLVALTGMSNSLGMVTNLKPIIAAAHEKGAKVLVDACQLAAHSPIDVQELDADFLVFSAHKLYGPTGVGVLYGKTELLDRMPPFLGGGEMIQQVFEDHFTPNDLPHKFEAGTQNIAGVVAFKAALDYISSIGWDQIQKIETELTEYALSELKKLDFITIIGPQTMKSRGSILSFTMDGVHPHDIAEGLSQRNICIRAGHHCCQVLMDHWNLPATARMSFGVYNEKEDVDKAVKALKEVYHYFNG